MHWTHQITLCNQPCHRGFTVQITDSPNMVVPSTMPWRIYRLEYYKYSLLRYHVKMEGKRGKIQMTKGTYRV